jgi:hypothetical protein
VNKLEHKPMLVAFDTRKGAVVVFSADVSFVEDDIPVMESKILTVLDTLTSRLL